MATLDELLAMNGAGVNIDAFGRAFSAASHFSFGQTAQKGEAFQAAQLRSEADNAAATGQRQAQDAQVQSQYIASRALAVAAASGGGASDPGVVTLMARNAQMGAYHQAVALYNGADRARALNLQASAKDYQGKEVAFNSDQMAAAQTFGAATTLMSGRARGQAIAQGQQSLRQKYGGGMPTMASIPDVWANNGPGE